MTGRHEAAQPLATSRVEGVCLRRNARHPHGGALRRCSRAGALLLPLVLALAGCGSDLNQPIARQAVEGVAGSTFGGQQPIVGATVTLWGVGTSGYGAGATLIATASAPTSASGNFTFGKITCPYSNTPTYLLSSGGNPGSGTNAHIVLAAASGACGALGSATVNINEVSTAATAYAMSQFFTTTLGGAYTTDIFGGQAAGSGTYNLGLVNADLYTVPTLVNLAAGSGAVANTTNTSGTITRTFESAKLNTIANILAACVNSTGSTSKGSTCGTLFSNTNDGNGTPSDTLQAAVQMALYPYKNVANLFRLPPAASPFVGLSTQPNDWTLAISYTSPAFQLGVYNTNIGPTLSNIDIDASGNVWFPTNSPSSQGVAYLDPHSSAPTFAGPYLTGLANPQYLAITNQGRVYSASTQYVVQVAYTSTTAPGDGTYGTPSTATGSGGPLVATYSGDFNGDFGTRNQIEPGDDILLTTGGTRPIYVGYAWPGNPQDNGRLTDNSLHYDFNIPSVSLAITSNFSFLSVGGGDGEASCDMEDRSGVQLTTGAYPCYTGGIAQTTYNSFRSDAVQAIASNNSLCDLAPLAQHGSQCFASPIALSYPQGVAVDGLGNVWIANYSNASVSTLGYTFSSGTSTDFHATSTLPYLHGTNNGGTMINPIGIAIDNSGNVWVSNGCVKYMGCTPGAFTLSELVGAGAPTLTPLVNGIENNTTGSRPH